MPPESLFSFSYLSPLTFLKKYKPMKSNVTDRLSEYFPGHFPDEPVEDEYLFYRFLHHLGIYCADRFGQPESRRVLDSIDRIYRQDNLFDCNAIENEFLCTLATRRGTQNLLEDLSQLPEPLWKPYTEVLLKTQKS
jgi:hypothetical protein